MSDRGFSRGFPVVLVLLGGCIAGQPTRDADSAPGPLPYAAIRAAPAPGETQIFLTAGIGGRFRIDDACVLVEGSNGGFVLPHFHDGTTVGRDGAGPYLRDAESAIKFRNGDRFRGGGGYNRLETLRLPGQTRSPIPKICLDRVVSGEVLSVNPGLMRP
jgi:hypothetical protein